MKKEEIIEVDFSLLEDMEEIVTPANKGSSNCCNTTNNYWW